MNLKKEKCKVVMIKTLDGAEFDCPFIKCIGFDNKLNLLGKSFWNNETWQGQNLYIVSDEKFNEGDWILADNNVIKLNKGDNYNMLYHCKKIVASTDKSLNLPEPSPEFIKKFVEEYNKGNLITYVNVDFIFNTTNEDWSKRPVQLEGFYTPKMDKNNFITITKIKESWNKDEIKELFNKFRKDFPLHRGIQIMDNDLDTWINENL